MRDGWREVLRSRTTTPPRSAAIPVASMSMQSSWSRDSALRPFLAAFLCLGAACSTAAATDAGTTLSDAAVSVDAEAGQADAAPPDAGTPQGDAGELAECGAIVSPSCRGDLPEAECRAAGGIYNFLLNPECACATSDANCPCTSSDECEGACEDREAREPMQCATAVSGLCTAHVAAPGCACVFEPDIAGNPPAKPRFRCI